jgi:peroxiredoxin
MKCSIALLNIVAGMLLVVGCSKSEVASTEPKPIAQSNSDAQAIDAGRTADSQVTPAAAVEEKPTEPAGVKIGDAGPAWENLTGTDDKQHNLKDLADAKAVAVIFTCNTCPVAVAYEDRLNQLARDYEDKGVSLVAINVNNNEGNKMPAMKERAEEKGFTFAYLYDPSQKIARDYGATVTPHVFLLDDERKVVYMGAIDDNMDTAAVKQHHLKDAIDATLAGQEPPMAETKQFGCGIKYE